MSGRKKVFRAITVSVCIYIILNILIYGIMTAYLNTGNIIHEDKLVMAEIYEQDDKKNIRILGREYSFNMNNSIDTAVGAILYCLTPDKVRVCTQLISEAGEIIFEQ